MPRQYLPQSNERIILECDASPYGVEAVLGHRIDGKYRPIAFRSRTPRAAEKNYSQIEREALALLNGVTRFRDYLPGREFNLITDHRPLMGLLRADQQTPTMAAARIQRWAITLCAYKYRLQHRPGKMLCNADALSHLPIPMQHGAEPVGITPVVLAWDQQDLSALPTKELQAVTAIDGITSQACQYTRNGWPCSIAAVKEVAEY